MKQLIILTLLTLTFSACTSVRTQSVPTIKTSQDWTIDRACGYEGCTPYVEYLNGKEVSVRIVSFKNFRPDSSYLSISITIVTPENQNYYFNPALSYVEFPEGNIVNSRGFECNTPPFSRNTNQYIPLGSGPKVKGKIWDCFSLEFNCNPQIEDKYSLKIEGLKKGDNPIELPALYFSPQLR